MNTPDNSNHRASRRVSRRPTHIATMRQGIHQLFRGQSVVGNEPATRTPESPKTPRLILQTSTTRFELPRIQRVTTSPSGSPTYASPTMASISTPSPLEHSPASYRPLTPNTFRSLQPGTSMTQPPPVRYNTGGNSRQFNGVDPEERILAESIAQRDRRRRTQHKKNKNKKRNKKPKTPSPPRRTCLGTKSSKLRRKIAHCIVSGLLLVTTLSLYLGLALSGHNIGQEFHVLLILTILAVTVFLCHSFVTLIILLLKPAPTDGFIPDMESMHVSPLGYAAPVIPIRVTLRHDEEALIGSRSDHSNGTKVTPPPPAYGLWRESVRVDPDRLFWARNTAAPPHARHGSQSSSGDAPRRPPSYMSDDGVEYVVEAAGRSIAPTTDVPLPLHPSERGRMGPVRMCS